MERFIERLPLAQRQALVLRYVFDLSSADIAAIVGSTPEAVRMQQSRALAFLRRRMAALGRTPRRGERIRSRLLIPQSRVLRVRRFGLFVPGPTG